MTIDDAAMRARLLLLALSAARAHEEFASVADLPEVIIAPSL